MPLLSRRDRNSFIMLSILTVLVGIVSTGCSPSEPEIIKSVNETSENVSQKAKDKLDVDAETAQPAKALSDKELVPVVSAEEAGEDAYAVEDPTWITAAEAGEDAYAVEDHSAVSKQEVASPTQDECNMRWTDACEALRDVTRYDDAAADVEKRQQTLEAPTDAELTDHNGTVLPRVIPGLTVGMPYAQARQLILADGWQPAAGLNHEGNNNGLDDYAEVAQCSGTGMGLCIMAFTDKEMNRFSVTTWGSGPDVRDWTPVQ